MIADAAIAPAIWPLIVYGAAVLFVISAMLGISYLLGQHHNDRATGDPYESGVPPTGGARLRFGVKFYLMAVFFVIFDLEAAFLFAWAVVAREAGWPAYFEALIFVLVLLVALGYLWRQGALDWAADQRRRMRNGSLKR